MPVQKKSGNLLKALRIYIYIYIYTHALLMMLSALFINIAKADQSKHTPGKKNNDPYINQSDQTKVIYTGIRTEFKSHWVPHLKGLAWHMFSDESNKLETYIYITPM